jgi:hypothetical protein
VRQTAAPLKGVSPTNLVVIVVCIALALVDYFTKEPCRG